MKDEEQAVDLRLRWRETQSRRDLDRDSVSAADTREDSELELESPLGGVEENSESAQLHEEEQELESEEEFQWTADRERALTEALQQTPEGAVPRVQLQLQAIAQGLEANSLDPERTQTLLKEVESYLNARLQAELGKAKVEDEVFMQARTEKINALYAYQESLTALAEYSRNEDPLQLKVAAYAAEQGGAFLSSSRQILMESEPELEDEDEYDDEDDENYEDEEE